MTEAEWNTCADPAAMLDFLGSCPHFTARKARLFAAAMCRRIWPLLGDGRSRRAILMAERHADSLASDAALAEAAEAARRAGDDAARAGAGGAAYAACGAAYAYGYLSVLAELRGVAADTALAVDPPEQFPPAAFGPRGVIERAAQAELLRDIFDNPFRIQPDIDPGWLAWNGGTVRLLAEAAYLERPLPSGELDPARLGVLADALEEAGCADADLLGHFRSPGPHLRGCWALDLLLGRE